MRTEKVTAIRKQSFENFPLCISRQVITELFPLLKDAPEDSCNSHNFNMLRNNTTREFVVFGWIGKKSKH